MKKNIFLLIIIFIILGSTNLLAYNATTERETNAEDQTTKTTDFFGYTRYVRGSTSLLGKSLTNIGETMNGLLLGLVINIHPFPAIMDSFYYNIDNSSISSKAKGNGPEDAIIFDAKKHLLISDEYYKTNSSSVIKAVFGGINSTEYEQNLLNKQKTRWNVITLLFCVFICAEILLTAIWNYVLGKESFLFKDLVIKIATCLILFLICAALPFLLESVRYGLTKIAFTLYLNENESAKKFDIFQMPGKFLGEMSYLMDMADPSWIGANAVPQLGNSSGNNIKLKGLGLLLVSLLYLLFKCWMCFELIKAALHIFMNILEIYFLLIIVMLFIPFSVFSPTKSIGEKCIMSLFFNLIECFIIFIMLLILIPACKMGCMLLLDTTKAGAVNVTSFNFNVHDVIGMNTFLNGSINNVKDNSFLINEEGCAVLTKFTYTADTKNSDNYLTGYFILYDLATPTNSSTQNNKSPQLLKYVSSIVGSNLSGTIYEDCIIKGGAIKPTVKDILSIQQGSDSGRIKDKHLISINAKESTIRTNQTDIVEVDFDYCVWADNIKNYLLNAACTVENLPQKESLSARSLFNYIYANPNRINDFTQSAFVSFGGKQKKIETDIADKSISIESTVSDHLIINHLVVLFLCLYLPCYFVLQSSQIVQALIQGGVAQESFSNALSQGSRGAATKIVNGAVSLIGFGAKTYSDSKTPPKKKSSGDDKTIQSNL